MNRKSTDIERKSSSFLDGGTAGREEERGQNSICDPVGEANVLEWGGEG